MTIHDPTPGDIYKDQQGNCWRVVGVWYCPVVSMENIEGGGRRTGGFTGYMWNGYKRINKRDDLTQPPPPA